MNKANYSVIYISADEIEDIPKLADKAERALETANGFSFAALTMKDAEIVGPMRLALALKVSEELERRRSRRVAPDGTVRT